MKEDIDYLLQSIDDIMQNLFTNEEGIRDDGVNVVIPQCTMRELCNLIGQAQTYLNLFLNSKGIDK